MVAGGAAKTGWLPPRLQTPFVYPSSTAGSSKSSRSNYSNGGAGGVYTELSRNRSDLHLSNSSTNDLSLINPTPEPDDSRGFLLPESSTTPRISPRKPIGIMNGKERDQYNFPPGAGKPPAPGSWMRFIVPVTVLLAIDGIISLALVSSTVSFLHNYGEGPFEIGYPLGVSSFLLSGHPAGLVTDHGHTVNAAGGTAVVLVGGGGVLGLWSLWRFHSRRRKDYANYTHFPLPKVFQLWAIIVVLSCLLTLGALIYTFVETRLTSGQAIDPNLAQEYDFPRLYPDDRWTPETWFEAVIALPLEDPTDEDVIRDKLKLMRGWKWNTIPMFLLGLTLAGLVLREVVVFGGWGFKGRRVREEKRQEELGMMGMNGMSGYRGVGNGGYEGARYEGNRYE
ncbi:hypothetical protein QBC41DRAFT_212318 [Cercophora samala]|uniref:Uncharacterized protein n=1 Tax=Cercophora samala TaxID=330535 RepID=A0AA40DIC9_9PEZI|nr:hypothetical protein QBC41DRAFT_212318 [Cercophora samala]